MRVKADLGLCQGHGVCAMEAPGVFRLTEAEDGSYAQVEVLEAEPAESLRGSVEAAVRYCPNRVLSIEDDTPPRP